ncbi:MAG: 4-hydroxy-3-methylbut-2-enyl diphosphate reductase [Treponema sp.]|nr:4-hydroxy-3-methylbut-2-enyl diphosphate reductase [Treponema sp.]
MKVIRARAMGYCAGVRRAMEIALRESALRECGFPVFTEGRLIHNPKALESLKAHGVRELDSVSDLQRSALSAADYGRGITVVLRAHGVTPEREAELSAIRGVRIADATCPKVKNNQLKARYLVENGFCLFLAGEKSHAEIVGLMGYADCIVVETADEARRESEKLFHISRYVKTALMGQTTLSPAVYDAVTSTIREIFPNTLVIDTVCSATKDRQDATEKLCAFVDAVVVIGGKESANTRGLFHLAKASGKAVYLIEDADELPTEVFAYETVGVSAGASTPDEIIDEVENHLMRRGKCQ